MKPKNWVFFRSDEVKDTTFKFAFCVHISNSHTSLLHPLAQRGKKNDSKDFVRAEKFLYFYKLKIEMKSSFNAIWLTSLKVGCNNYSIILRMKISFLVYLRSANGFKSTSWYILSRKVSLIAPVIMRATLFWTIPTFFLKDSFNGLRNTSIVLQKICILLTSSN